MTDKPQKTGTPFDLERLMRQAQRSFDELDFATEDEFRDSLPDMIEDGLQDKLKASLKDDPREQAQDLAYQAYESGDSDIAQKKVDKALKLDPECVDALALQAFLTCEDAGDLIVKLEHAATCGEERLGEDFFAEYMGDFWPLVEARPYMRTIKQLAEALWSVGRRFDAVENYENLLDLDPEDHMNNSPLLLSCLLSMGEVQRSWDLLEEHDDGENAVFLWAWVLVEVLAMNPDGARVALETALEANPHVILFLFGLIEDTGENPPYLAAGSQAEARICAQILAVAWEENPRALYWLETTLVEMGMLEMANAEDDEIPPETAH